MDLINKLCLELKCELLTSSIESENIHSVARFTGRCDGYYNYYRHHVALKSEIKGVIFHFGAIKLEFILLASRSFVFTFVPNTAKTIEIRSRG